MNRVVRVLAPNPGPFTLEGTNTWIVGERPSVVIDPGPDHAGHLRSVLEAAAPIHSVLLTHRHPDHAPGAARLAAAVRVPVYAFHPEAGERPLPDGEVVGAGTLRIRAVHTPGHTADHVAFFLESDAALFTGDAVLGRGTSVISPPEGDMAAYVASLRTMLGVGARVIYPGHGPVVSDPRAKLEEYLAHRAERERQVIQALARGRETPEEIVALVYAMEIPESMFPAAARSVLAHLLKLEAEGRVARRIRAGEARFHLVRPKACQRCGGNAEAGSRYCRRCRLELLQEAPAERLRRRPGE
jgi:glyoxylase-like metal-dependent hydrolase (beta-lactamase superfamily II)